MNKTFLLSTISILLLLSGCAQIQLGRDFDLATFEERIQHGTTTQTQVQQWLGEPVSRGIVVNTENQRLTRWVYYYGSGRLSHMENAGMKTLEVQFDENGIVRAFDWVNNQ